MLIVYNPLDKGIKKGIKKKSFFILTYLFTFEICKKNMLVYDLLIKQYCQHCDCGNHRGCVPQPLPKSAPGTTYRQNIIYRDAKEGCPCIAKDDARKQKATREQKEEEKLLKKRIQHEKALACRMIAIEKALWG